MAGPMTKAAHVPVSMRLLIAASWLGSLVRNKCHRCDRGVNRRGQQPGEEHKEGELSDVAGQD